MVKLYAGGQSVKTHARQRLRRPDDDRINLPVEQAGYAMRDLAALIAV